MWLLLSPLLPQSVMMLIMMMMMIVKHQKQKRMVVRDLMPGIGPSMHCDLHQGMVGWNFESPLLESKTMIMMMAEMPARQCWRLLFEQTVEDFSTIKMLMTSLCPCQTVTRTRTRTMQLKRTG